MAESHAAADSAHATRALRAKASSRPSSETSQPAARRDLSGIQVCSADLLRDDLTGLELDPYELGPKIGSGGMGRVFRARHIHLDRVFAIKFVAAEIAAVSDVQLRFEQETRALGKLQHPHIVNAVDAGCTNGLRYLVTEFIDGQDLAQAVHDRGPLPVAEACDVIRQAALGLAHSHAAGFVHRDIKPSNLIVDRHGVVKILDFGLVHGGTVDHQLTAAGDTLGTWDFLAPEQAHDASQVDHRCDLYSLGCTLLFLLSGQAPFGDPQHLSPASKLRGHLFETPKWLQDPPRQIPAALIQVLQRLLAKSPAERFQTADNVVEALAPFTALTDAEFSQNLHPARAWQRYWLTTLTAAAGLIGLCWWMWGTSEPATDALSSLKAAETHVVPNKPPEQAELPAAKIPPADTGIKTEPQVRSASLPKQPISASQRVVTVSPQSTKNASPILLPGLDFPARHTPRKVAHP